jgi:hypothetical protein
MIFEVNEFDIVVGAFPTISQRHRLKNMMCPLRRPFVDKKLCAPICQ